MAQLDTSAGRLPALIAADGAARVGRASPMRFLDAGFEAQLLGQPGEKRGLRGGPPVLEAARGAYLSAEYAGEGDRRPQPGLLKVREI